VLAIRRIEPLAHVRSRATSTCMTLRGEQAEGRQR
jgi:hypothetical protein